MTLSPLPLLMLAILGLAACKPADIPANDSPLPEGAVVTAANGAALDGAEAVPADEGGDDDTDAAANTPDLTGRWVGVEGMVLTVADGDGPGTYTLTMQYDLDHKGVFAGTASGDGIAFTRDGQSLMLRPTDGAATGLKYLADKTDCLTVKSGEGYCRA